MVRSTADPTYTPWRIISPAGFDVFAQADLGAPNAAIEYALYKVDQLADSVRDKFVSFRCAHSDINTAHRHDRDDRDDKQCHGSKRRRTDPRMLPDSFCVFVSH